MTATSRALLDFGSSPIPNSDRASLGTGLRLTGSLILCATMTHTHRLIMTSEETGATEPRTEPRAGQREEDATAGWDTGAFWIPSLDQEGLFLAGVLVLFVLHFNGLFGLAGNDTLLFGWLPVNLGYYVLLGVIHVIFLVVLCSNWPDSPVSAERRSTKGESTDRVSNEGGGES